MCHALVLAAFSILHVQSEMEKMKKIQHVQAVYVRKMQALPGKVRSCNVFEALQMFFTKGCYRASAHLAGGVVRTCIFYLFTQMPLLIRYNVQHGLHLTGRSIGPYLSAIALGHCP